MREQDLRAEFEKRLKAKVTVIEARTSGDITYRLLQSNATPPHYFLATTVPARTTIGQLGPDRALAEKCFNDFADNRVT